MERWLSKPRVLIALNVALLCATLNRPDPLIYGLFLLLLTLCTLSWLLPWAAVRRVTVRAAGAGEVREGEASMMTLTVEQRGWWPVFMVEVQTCWQWAGREVVLRHVVPMLRSRRPLDLGDHTRFACRGHYRLREVRVACSFPLGLLEARHNFGGVDASFLVLPRPSAAIVAPDLPVSHDDRGLQTMRRLGTSNELGALRDYEPGDPVRRVHWRASARVGHLVVQQYLQSGSPLLRVVTQIPAADEAGLPASPGEQAIRAAAGLCRQALSDGIRVRAYLPGVATALSDVDAIDRALAAAAPGTGTLGDVLMRAADDLQDGDLLVVVVSAGGRIEDVVAALQTVPWAPTQLRVYVAAIDARQPATPGEPALAASLRAAGVTVWPCPH